MYQGWGEGTGQKVWWNRLEREGGIIGAGTVDRDPCHTCRKEKEMDRWMTHPNESLLKTDDDEREKL
jgi:hypothetical protein